MTPSEPIFDEAFPVRTIPVATLRINVEYREVGAGVDSVELIWENVLPPDVGSVVYILRTLLRKGEVPS
jgi:hypothetical protein